METFDQSTSAEPRFQPPVAESEGKATVGKPRAREVQSRYMQAKPTTVAPRPAAAPSLQGRHSLAACNSTGWVELQLGPNCTPLMVNTGASSAVFTQTNKARRMQTLPTPTPRTTTQQLLHRQGIGQQQRRHLNPQRPQQTPQLASRSVQQQQQQHHDVGFMPDTSHSQSSAGRRPPGMSLLPLHTAVALISPGSSRSSTSCSARPALDVIDPEFVQQPGPADLCTPHVSRLGSSMLVGSNTAMQRNRLGMSADVTGLTGPSRTAANATRHRRMQLEEFKQHKKRQQQQVAQRNAARAKQGGFREPQLKPAVKVGPVLSVDMRGAEGSATSRITATPAASNGSATSRSASVDNGSSASQFTATMSILQQMSSGSKPAKPHSSGKAVRPAGVPLLQMDRLQQGPGSSPFQVMAQQPAVRSSFAPGSCSRIPSFSSGGGLHEAVTTPLTSRAVSNAAHVPLPDATPRTMRDAPPSKLPKTPRGQYTDIKTVVDDDVAAHIRKPAVPGLKLGGLAVVDKAADSSATPPLASSRGSCGGTVASPTAAAATKGSTGNHVLSSSMSKSLSKPVATPSAVCKASLMTSSRQAGRYSSSSAAHQQPQLEYSRLLKTPRVPLSPQAAADSVQTRKSDQERVEETKQQLKLLRHQNLQLRLLACRVEQAVRQKREKAAEILAAATAANVDLYGQLAAVQKQLQHEQWTSEMQKVLQQQLPKLRSWSLRQEQHEGDILQLQHACSAALSHVPLWNGAAVGPHLEQPDLDLLQLQLVHGMQLMDEAKPALQQLLGPDLLAAQTRGIADTAGSSKQQSHSGRAADTCSSVRATASLAEQLMCVATEESSLLGELAKRLDRLSDLHLYANSMQIQLAHMKQAAASD